ncbi:MAG: TylF/MycF/NovP-related O-methyltransferase [bacterium]|nr:TylF/MycF/NovP-related O-methyltransferase [bacterium]
MITFVKNIFRPYAWARKLYAKARFLLALLKDVSLNPGRAFLLFRVMPFTMVEYAGVRNVYDLAEIAVREGIQGAFVECGVWRGGVAGVLGSRAKQEGKGRVTWLFDSFEGLPEPTKEDGSFAKEYSGEKDSGKLVSIEKCVGPITDVRNILFSILRLQENQVRLVQGWFQDTLPQARSGIGKIALLRLDADWYESTKCALENLYDLVSSGGYVVIDDYGHWEGCRKAVDEFLQARGVTVAIHPVDSMVAYFQKP